MSLRRSLEFLRLAGLIALAGRAGGALAQAVCTSQGEPVPTAIVERFIPDDCEACWRSASPALPKDVVVADWVVPSGDSDAPLAAAALDESLRRLRSSGAVAAARSHEARRLVDRPVAGRLRLAQGPVVNDYLGVSVEWKPAPGATRGLDAWVLLVEDVPAGTAGTVLARSLVRGAWSVEGIAAGKAGWTERRAMHVPAGADPDRLRLIGWLGDHDGRITVVAATRCRR